MKKYYKICFWKDCVNIVELSQEAYCKELEGYMNNMNCYVVDIPSMWMYHINICGEWCDVLLMSRG